MKFKTFHAPFVVGLLNTLLVSGLGIVLATLLGFVIGTARLSSNWLISRMAAAYIETFRNIPLLLQLFFWYFAVLRALPSPRQSLSLGDAVYLNIRGLYLPRPLPEPGFWWIPGALFLALICVYLLARWARSGSKGAVLSGALLSIFAPDPELEKNIRLAEEARQEQHEEEEEGQDKDAL